MYAPSFVPPEPIRRLRDLTRHRRSLVRDRTREKQRLEKLLEDAQIKLSLVASDMFGVSGRTIWPRTVSAGLRTVHAGHQRLRHAGLLGGEP
jgi:Transposase